MLWQRIEERLVGDIVVISLENPETLQIDPDHRLVETIRRLIGSGRTRFVLNLRELRYIDSDGLGQILEAFQCARDAEGSLKLCEVTRPLRDILRATRLDSFLEEFDSEQDAIRASGARS